MAHGNFKDLLRNPGFRAFLWTQFLGAFNDSFYQSVAALHASKFNGGIYVPLVPAIFVLPSLLFSGWSGYLADRVSKRSVLIGVKVFELFIMLAGLAALVTGHIEGMMLVVFLLGVHAAIFSPAKYGIVPEMLADADLSRGNALLEMSTFVAIVLGTAMGGILLGDSSGAGWHVGLVALAVSISGLVVSLRITRVPPSGAADPFRRNPFGEIVENTKHLLRDRPLWLAVLGVAFFWFAGVLLKTDLLFFGNEALHTTSAGISMLWVFLAVGIGCGNMLAGKLSGDKVELGLVPLGSGGMAVFAFALCAARGSLAASAIAVAFLAVSSGLFVVPQYAFMQQRAGVHEKGRTIATNNFIQSLGMVLASVLLAVFHDRLHVSATVILAAFGVMMAVVTVFAVRLVPERVVRFFLWLLVKTFFRIRVVNPQNMPATGAALLVSNHVSHIDGILIEACMPRETRFMIWKPYFDLKPFQWFLRRIHAIPVAERPREAVQSIRAAREALTQGHAVCIFAEGAVTRTGNLQQFKRGMEKIAAGTGAVVVPVHIDRMWGSIFSFEGGRFFRKLPKRMPYPVTISFGSPLPSTASAHEVRQAIQELSADAVPYRKTPADTLDARFVRNARRHWNRVAMADSTGRELTYGKALTAALLLGRQMPAEPMIGVLLPSTVGGALANIAVTLAGRVPVNLNFTAGAEAMAHAVTECGIRTVITSRKMPVQPPDGVTVLFIEELFAKTGKSEQLRAYIAARFLPMRRRSAPDSPAAVIFSSGSTAVPKGVALTHYNVLANIEAFGQLFWLTPDDRIVGVLPFFHSFGFTVTVWFPLIAGCGVVYHPNPTDARAVGELVSKYRGTLLLSTPTFCSTYTRKIPREHFGTLRYVLVGAEKLRQPVADAFREKFGIDPLEGYGCTEMSPVIAVNAPTFEAGRDTQIGNKPGTVGKPIPGVAARVVDPVTFRPLPPNTEGLLLVKGANRMSGYLNQPNLTADVFRDGWYITGDIAVLDDEDFLRLTDRLSRFSKIGGEMVPHLRIEEALDEIPCVVTGVPDEQRGERLVLLYADAGLSPSDIWQRLAGTALPRLWIPKRENIYRIDALPQLGTGKLDLRAVKREAERLAAVTA
jgi:acyl-[acyl-carrier-protein]-phospholipid O-acyltransferase/long-chain-fatty-acid--[acyl-carrier-protein] ligase